MTATRDTINATSLGEVNDVLARHEATLNGGSLSSPKVTNPNGLRRWRAALADARYGTAVITCIGDSITQGVGSDGSSTDGGTTVYASTYRTRGWVGQLKSLFADRYGSPGEGWIACQRTTTEKGGRITVSGATAGTYGPDETGVKASSGQTITLTTLDNCTEIDVWVWDGSSTTTATYTVDGGGSVNLGAGTGNANATTWTKRTITGLSAATHTVVISGPASGTVFIAGFVALNQTTGVQLHNFGVTGTTSANILGFDSQNNGNATAQARSLAGIGKVPAADLVILSMGVNDFGNQNAAGPTQVLPGTDPTTYGQNIQAIVNQAITNGACVLLVGEPRQNSANYPSPQTYTEDQYWAQAEAVAQATDHCAFIDVGEVWGTNVVGQALSLYTTGSVHPTRRGHGDMARILFHVLAENVYEELVAA